MINSMWHISKLISLRKSKINHIRSCKTMSKQKFKHSCADMRCLEMSEVKGFFQHLDCIICDADGVLWIEEKPVEGSVETFNWFRDQGKQCYIVTNNASITRKGLHEKACRMGIDVNERQIVSTANYAAKYLKDLKFNKKAYVIGKESLSLELENKGIKHIKIVPDPMVGTIENFISNLKLEKDVGAVVVGTDEYFTFPKLAKAFMYLMDPQCLFIATSRDVYAPTPSTILPEVGCIVQAIETCAKRSATVIGKPNPQFMKYLINKDSINPGKTLMIGDSGSSDMLFGHNSGFYTLLVFTGISTLNDIKQWQASKNNELQNQVPDFCLPKMSTLREILCG